MTVKVVLFLACLTAAPAVAQTSRLTDSLAVSPAELARLKSGRLDASYAIATAKDEQTYDDGGGGKIVEDVTDSALRLLYARPRDNSLTYGVGIDSRKRRIVRDTNPGVETDQDRTRHSLTTSAAFKVMDRIVLGGGLGHHWLSSDDGTSSTFWSSDLAIAIKGEAYDAGIVQQVTRLELPDDEMLWTHAQNLYLRYQTQAPSAWRLVVQRGPQTFCCVPATSHHLSYAIGNERMLTESLELTVVYRYAPGYKEEARFGHVYDVTRHGLDVTGELAFGTSAHAGLGLAYEVGRDDAADVEIPTALETVETAAYKASRFAATLLVGVGL